MSAISAWLKGLSGRERLLLGAAGALVLVLGLNTLLLAPLRAMREDARLDYVDAGLALAEARGAAALAQTRAVQAAATGGGNARAAVTGTAQAKGLAIARMTPVDQGGLAVRFEQADPAALYAWLADLEVREGVSVRRASLRRASVGPLVEADIVLSAGGAG